MLPNEDDDELDSLREHAASIRKLDENTSFMTDHFPRLWRRFFERLKEEGFDNEEALSILKTYIISRGTNSSNAP